MGSLGNSWFVEYVGSLGNSLLAFLAKLCRGSTDQFHTVEGFVRIVRIRALGRLVAHNG